MGREAVVRIMFLGLGGWEPLNECLGGSGLFSSKTEEFCQAVCKQECLQCYHCEEKCMAPLPGNGS